jgi:hypothetical protein
LQNKISNNNKQYKSGDIELAEDKERHEVEDEDNSDLEDTYNEDENEKKKVVGFWVQNK